MKSQFLNCLIFVPFLISGFILSGCEYDNYDPPSSVLTGEVTYQGEALGVRSNEVELELWQPAYELDEKIPVHIDQDGTFNSVLFDGTYYLTILNGPWVLHSDSITVEMNREANVNVEVEPFYIIENSSFSYGGGTISASFDVGEVNTSRDLEFVAFYVSGTSIVDRLNMDVEEVLTADQIQSLDSTFNLEIDLPNDLIEKGYVFTRVGVKTDGISEMIYSQVVKIDL